jgi:8-oxo-dGTP diphosphatase
MHHENPILTVDIVLLTMLEGRIHVALAARDKEPEKDKPARGGGYVHTNADSDGLEAALRTLRTKLEFSPRYIEQVFTEASAKRDPRGWSASIVYMAVQDADTLQDLAESRGMKLYDAEEGGAHLPENMAFDHRELVLKAVERLRSKASYSTIVGYFLPESFTLATLQSIYEVVLGRELNAPNFRRKILDTKDVLTPTAEMLHGKGRPSQGYRLTRHIDYFDRELT